MKNYNKRYVLALDPSGNFLEGKGTTGWCVFDCLDDRVTIVGEIAAATVLSFEEHWAAHLALIDSVVTRYGVENVHIVIEDYLLYHSKAQSQTNSRMETPQLLGVLKFHCWMNSIDYSLQTANEVKERWANEVLQHKGYIKKDGRGYESPLGHKPLSRHSADAVRHAVHFATFKNAKEQSNVRQTENDSNPVRRAPLQTRSPAKR